MKPMYATAAVLLTACSLLGACKEKDGKSSRPYTDLTVTSPYPYQVRFEGSTETVEFTCSFTTSWEASVRALDGGSWISISSPARGEGDGTVRLAVDPNPDGAVRLAELTFSSNGATVKHEIMQEAKGTTLTFPGTTIHSCIQFTEDHLNRLKSAYTTAPAGSTLRSAFDALTTRCNNYSASFNASAGVQPAAGIAENNSDDYYTRILNRAAIARDYALLYHLTGTTSYATNSVAIMMAWANFSTDIDFTQYRSADDEDGGASSDYSPNMGMKLARSIYPIFSAYDMLQETGVMTDDQKAVIARWFRATYPQIMVCQERWRNNNYHNMQLWQNHLVAASMGVMAAGAALRDPRIVRLGLNSQDNTRNLVRCIQGTIFVEADGNLSNDGSLDWMGPCHREVLTSAYYQKVQTGEIYDRYRHDTGRQKGFQYSGLSTTLLVTAAQMANHLSAKINGQDIFDYVAPTGENLLMPLEYYVDFYNVPTTNPGTNPVEGSYALSGYRKAQIRDVIPGKTTYYGDEDEKDGAETKMNRIGIAGDYAGIFELGWSYYPNSVRLKTFVMANNYGRGGKAFKYDDPDPAKVRNNFDPYSSLNGYFRFFSVRNGLDVTN